MLSKLNVSNEILKAVRELGFSEWTEIQLKSIPLIQEGKDVLGQSYTGSGKTAAFSIPLIEKIIPNGGIQVLIIAPTRELSEQIMQDIHKFSKYKKIHVEAIYGGVSINPQIHGLRTAEIVVGTPGRLMDHMQRQTINFTKIKTVVLDEADRMLDMGFIDDIRRILGHISRERQTLLFSATMPPQIRDIVSRFMNKPVQIKTQTYVDEGKLEQIYFNVDARDKTSMLIHLLKHDKVEHTIIFCSTRHMVDILARNLRNNNILCQSLHGGLTQSQRQKSMELFHEHKSKILIASDVAARGIDIKNVSHVINYDVPKTSKEYIHRIGRTARAGTNGKVITLVSQPDYDNFRSVLSDRSLHIEKLELPKFEKVIIQQGGFRGHTQGQGPMPGGSFRGERNRVERRDGERGEEGNRPFGQRRSSGSRFQSRNRRPRFG